MNGISLNGINNIFQNPLTGNKGILPGNKGLFPENQGIFPGQVQSAKQDIIPKGTVSGVEKAAEDQKSGLTIQMNVDRDILELSEQPQETGLALGKPLAEMTDKERKDIAVQYWDEYTDLNARRWSEEIDVDEWSEELKVLNDRYGVDWAGSYVRASKSGEGSSEGAQYFTYTDLEMANAEEIESIVQFRSDKSIEDLDPAERNAKLRVDVTGTVDIKAKGVQAYSELQRKREEEVQSADEELLEEASDKAADTAAEVVSDEKENRLSSQLVKKLMEDYAFQGEKSAVERMRERIEEKRAEQRDAQKGHFEAFV